MMINQEVTVENPRKPTHAFQDFQTLTIANQSRPLPKELMSLVQFYTVMQEAGNLRYLFKFMNLNEIDLKNLNARRHFLTFPINYTASSEQLALYLQMMHILWKRMLKKPELLHVSLFTAANQGWAKILGILLDKGVSAEVRDANHYSLLMMSAFHDREDNVKVLLEHEADISAEDNNQNTALMWASFNGAIRLTIVEMIVSKAEKVEYDIVNQPNHEGRTPLMAAAQNANGRLVTFLLQHGARATEVDNQNKTALDYAHESHDRTTIAAFPGRGK